MIKKNVFLLLFFVQFSFFAYSNNKNEIVYDGGDSTMEDPILKVITKYDTIRVGFRYVYYEDDLRKNFTVNDYPFCNEHVYFTSDRGGRSCFKTKTILPEYYIWWEEGKMDTIPATNPLVQFFKTVEASCEIYGVYIAREAMCGCPAGPIKEDRRILYESDMVAIRKVIKRAKEDGILRRDNYKIIQMLEQDNVFCTNERAKNIVRMMDGACLEVHHFNVHWPLDKGKIKIADVVEGAKWTLNQVNTQGDSLEYVLYYGPFKGKDCADYTPDLFKSWLQQFWQAGLPKYEKRMIYHLNAFKYRCGASRPIAPESDPYSVLGCTKWLIKELNPWMD